jgi:hypothetical protein
MLWPLLKEMQLAPIINQHLPADPQAEFAKCDNCFFAGR